MVVLGAAAACLAAVLAPMPSGAEDDQPRAPIVKKKKIAPGVTFTRIIQRQVPRRTFVLRIVPSKPVTVDVSLATAVLGGPRRTVLQIARTHEALAAVNGDFPPLDDFGRPARVFAQDGELVQSGLRSALFALTRDEASAFLGSPKLVLTATDRDTGQTWRLDRWNLGPPAPGEIAAFSPLGGTLEAPPSFACSVRLLPVSPRSLDADGVVSDYVVDAAGCTQDAMARNGGVVLSAPPATDEAIHLLTMTPGMRMRLRWSLGWQGVYDVIGGTPILVRDGEIAVQPCPASPCTRHPRTGIGYTDNGAVLLVVVDGRQPNWSTGASLHEFATIMQDLGAVQALNLDGGGSSTMVVEDEVVNRPSDGEQRPISNAVLVLPGPDPGEV